MKNRTVALVLNSLLPGAGLAYLGRWKWAILNLSVVLFVGILTVSLLPDEIFDKVYRDVAYACAGGSGALAYQLATRMNQEASVSHKAE